MKILVLGGTGAIGIPVVQILAAKGNRVLVTSRRQKISSVPGIKYIVGNAKDLNFLKFLLATKYDAIIDFMVYTPDEFKERMSLFLKSTKQYFIFSSSRVYADSEGTLITEETPRLLNAVQDKEYLRTNEYALAKAREEDLLADSGYFNWTIIRPYITYNMRRLQLGVWEKEAWLYRALNGKAIVFGRDIASKYTTLTYGYDVALRISDLVGKKAAFGETIHIAANECILWEQVLTIYLDVIERKTGQRPRVHWVNNSFQFLKATDNRYQIKYDRLFNRKFDNTKAETLAGTHESYKKIGDGLSMCLSEFLDSAKEFLDINWRLEGAFDRITGDKTKLKDIPGWKNKIKYIIFRYSGGCNWCGGGRRGKL